ncbi:hypothetical protein TNCV_2142201 [Trichonephila clavipes]|uniref:Uncharacterized protein n=1 Tax=Trichonephila clavipes TaxID=2585209 RepID=A0A8X6S5E6_TRICX|nr:hypothetical protein TNCV_2142201 [Trichonephila clavipes]
MAVAPKDNAPTHTTLSVNQLLTSKNITVLRPPPYAPDLARHMRGSGKNGESRERPSKNVIPEVLPGMEAPNTEVCEG